MHVDTPILLVMVVDGTRPITRMPLAKDVISVGREVSNDLVLDDAAVSRRHFTLIRHGDSWHIAAVPGAGALYINGRLCDAADVRPGDQIAVGGVALRLEWRSESASGSASTHEPLSERASGGTPQINHPVPLLMIACPAGYFIVPLREASLTIGRAPDCGLIIPSRVISSHHGTLRRGTDGTYTFLVNVNTRNSATYGGMPVQRHTFRDRDTLLIGAQESGAYATFTYSASAAPHGTAAPQSAPFIPSMPSVPSIPPIPMEGPSWDGTASIGRDPASTYCLASPLVSWRHARLRRDSGGILIEDLGSTNGTYVNLARLDRVHRLAAGDSVQIGPYAFSFDGTRLMQQVATGPQTGLPVEAIDLVRTTRGGKAALLDHVTLVIQPGQFVAIIGGNGAGKSTLLKALAGIQPAQHGAVLFGGVDSYRNYNLFRGRIGYVPQADIVHATLTVKEALYYTARLRLSRDLRDDEIEQRIQLVLTAVDLSPHQGKLVRSLSGGERKRLSLAVELLAEPQVLFLDEPNAALDPNHRQELLNTIRSLAHQGRTLMMVTHFREDFDACDRVAVMGRGGQLCFYGSPTEALAFFQVERFEDIYAQIDEVGTAAMWRKRYEQLPAYLHDLQSESVRQTLSEGRMRASGGQYGWQAGGSAEPTSATMQLGLLLGRYARILTRDRVNVAILLLQAPVIGLILAAVNTPGAFTNASGPLDAQKVLFFLAIVAIWFGTSNAVREVSKEGDIYQRERLAGLRIMPYLLSKVGILALLCMVQTLVLLLIVTARTGLPPSSAGLFFSPLTELFIGTVLAGLAGLAMGLCVSTFANNPDKAVSAVPLVLLPQILLAGVIFPVSGPVQPLADMTISRWAVQALGTSADLDHLYYTQVHVVAGASTGGAGSAGNSGVPNFDPGDFDINPSPVNYAPGVAPGISWADAQGSRRQRVVMLWAVEGLLFTIFLGIAVARQKAKDPS